MSACAVGIRNCQPIEDLRMSPSGRQGVCEREREKERKGKE